MIDLEPITTEVRKVCLQAGDFIAKEAQGFSRSRVELKGKSDLVSYVDKQAEKMLVAGLKMILPEAGFITEEDTPNDEGREYTWIIY